MKYLVIPFILMALNSCGVLTPVKDAAVDHLLTPLAPERILTKQLPIIAIKRTSIPDYLDRQQLITRQSGALMISKLDIWAEPLAAGISRVTASNLSRFTGSMNIQPVENLTALDYTNLLEIQITQFESDAANQMIFQGTWKLGSIYRPASRSHFFHIVVPISKMRNPLDATVVAMDQALEQLAQQIFGKIIAHQ